MHSSTWTQLTREAQEPQLFASRAKNKLSCRRTQATTANNLKRANDIASLKRFRDFLKFYKCEHPVIVDVEALWARQVVGLGGDTGRGSSM